MFWETPRDRRDYTVKESIDRLMELIGLTEDDYIVHEDFASLLDGSNTEGYGWGSVDAPITARELLKKIAICYSMNIWVDREGKIRFDYLSDVNMNNPYYGFFSVAGRTATGNIIDLDNCFEEPTVKKAKSLNNINYYPDFLVKTSPAIEQNIVGDALSTPTVPVSYDVDGEDVIEIILEERLLDTIVNEESTTGTAEILGIEYTDFLIRIYVQGTGTIKITAKGVKPNILDYGNKIFLPQSDINIEDYYNVELHHERILYDKNWDHSFLKQGNWAFFNISYKNKKYEYSVNWRQDLTNNLGDIVEIENSYGIEKNMIITKQIYEYNGTLKGYTEGVGN